MFILFFLNNLSQSAKNRKYGSYKNLMSNKRSCYFMM